MKRAYIIIDSLGARHGSVKANSRKEAIETFIGDGVHRDAIVRTLLFAIDKEDLEVFKEQVSKLN